MRNFALVKTLSKGRGASVMAPKCVMSALPDVCEQLKNSMLEMGAEVDLDGLHAYADRHGYAW